MARAGVLIVLIALTPLRIAAQNRPNPVTTELAVQTALQRGRQFLAQGQPRRAAEILEEQLPHINGNLDYLAALRDAYSQLVRDLQLKRQDAEADAVQQKLRVLEQGLAPSVPPPSASPPSAPPNPLPLDPPPSKARAKVDPFQQAPLLSAVAEPGNVRDLIAQADAAFRRRDFAEAGRLFAQAHAKDAAAIGAHAPDWAYCRLLAVAQRLNAEKPSDPQSLAPLEREVADALRLAAGKPQLEKYGQSVLAHVHALQGRPATDAVPTGWSAVESANFRLLHRVTPGEAKNVLTLLDRARTVAFEKWHGTAASVWSPRCDVYLHATSADYAQATGKDPRWQGHATIEVMDRRVVKRRIDLGGDAAELVTSVLPREVTHVVLADMFPDPMLPRWADEAMAILAGPRDQVDRYLLALPKAYRDGKLFPIGQLLAMTDFPPAERITAFYVQSVSLVDLLVAERGAAHFALFLQQAHRYGYEKALKDSYGIRGFNGLQEYWQKKAFAEH